MSRFSDFQSQTHRDAKELPENLLLPIYHYITGIHNSSDKDVSNLILKPALSNVFIIFIVQYGLVAICGMLLNIYIICYVIQYKLYRDVTHAFMVNLCLCHFVQCAFVLPITLLLILTQNWIFGQFMCYFIPLLQVSFSKYWNEIYYFISVNVERPTTFNQIWVRSVYFSSLDNVSFVLWSYQV